MDTEDMTKDEVKISPEVERLGNSSEGEEIVPDNRLGSRVAEEAETKNGLDRRLSEVETENGLDR